ncbi:threonine-phosphate decarboxylase CobD [Brevibacillus ruminantium]|uniref:threonine-phosphate decarboxylase n=1 Tax=Brevibacillus ruminantium TaxID=2950604 RepID=A0ABY4WBI4_9BACL|nr:threonine-phosphate decarboxylase CobD [Brevibacillus ruminantium]USG64542.1 threonine-phosphate decarboxylase CobD [Brevibacillus ruminantium]
MSLLERYGHGGDLRTAEERFGLAGDAFLDYSANINPLGPPAKVLEAMSQSLSAVIRYPDPAHRSFKAALAEQLRIPESFLLPANGAAEAMALAILALGPQRVGVVTPCFSEYAQLSGQFGAQVIECRGLEEHDFKPDMEELYQLFQKAQLVFIASPNNPTGILYQPEELLKLAAWTDETDTYLVVDEAFLDFVAVEKQFSLADRLADFPRVLLMRSMTKMFAIPGLRLGYAIGHPELIRRMKEKQVSWSVNGLALLAGELCLQESAYEEQTRLLVAKERGFLANGIRELGWQTWPGEANFLLVRSKGELDAATLQERMGKRGILIRSCAMYPGLTDHDFRIAVRSRSENERLLQTFREVAEQGGRHPWV